LSKFLHAIPLLTLGCGSGDFEPLPGAYLASIVPTDDGCGFFTLDDVPEGDPVTQDVEVSFPEGGDTIIINGVACPWAARRFYCDEVVSDVDLSELPGVDIHYDAVATTLSSFHGIWIDPDTVTGDYSVVSACAGVGCQDALADGATVDCTSVATFTMELVE